jgi:hypothetical protein
VSEQDLRAMIDYASKFCERMFAKTGEISPMYHAVASNGEHFFSPALSADKDIGVAMIRALFDLRDAVRYIFIDEAWTLDKPLTDPVELDWINRHGIRKHPQRVEVVMIVGEDRDAGMISARRRIIRPKKGRAHLGPLEITTDVGGDKTVQTEGRMVGLLPVRGPRQ